MKGWQLVVTSVLVMALFTGAMPSLAWSQGRGQGFRPCPYEPYKCPAVGVCKPMTITGKVSRVYTETLQDNMYPGMAVLIDTKDKGQVRVHLGPVWYLERQEFRLTPGQEVQVQAVGGPLHHRRAGDGHVLTHAPPPRRSGR